MVIVWCKNQNRMLLGFAITGVRYLIHPGIGYNYSISALRGVLVEARLRDAVATRVNYIKCIFANLSYLDVLSISLHHSNPKFHNYLFQSQLSIYYEWMYKADNIPCAYIQG